MEACAEYLVEGENEGDVLISQEEYLDRLGKGELEGYTTISKFA